eukprot:Nitzschia sp. Nitz4//scaffold127_size64804//34737//35028//NITZ4_006178-RA/size64804-snap-gene-0.97-mRNA-1//-1//CDS//3329534756//6201//frame0
MGEPKPQWDPRCCIVLVYKVDELPSHWKVDGLPLVGDVITSNSQALQAFDWNMTIGRSKGEPEATNQHLGKDTFFTNS